MDCPRCRGLLVRERYSDFFLSFHMWRCFNCGAVIDRAISKNRRHSLVTRVVSPDSFVRRWLRRPPLPVS